MLKNIWMWILTNVFKIPSEATKKELEDNQKYAVEYERIDKINFNAIFSNKIANYVSNDSSMNITGDNARKDLLEKIGQSLWKKRKKIVSSGLGYGGIFLVPYVKGNKLFYNRVPQGRVTIDSIEGDLITGATILAEQKVISQTFGQDKVYIRWTNYRIENGNCIIEQKFTDGTGKAIDTPSFWQNIMLKQTISNCDRALLGYFKSPVNNRKMMDKYGVPITYGCEETIAEIRDTLKKIVREYDLKDAFIGADATMFGKNGLVENGLFKKLDTTEDNFFYEFSPAIRESSYYARLQELYQRLEKEIGTSAGILSEVQTQNATATEIKRAMYDTFSIVDDVRTNFEDCMEDFFYACNVLVNAYNLSPQGEYALSYDWSYSLLEDSQEAFNQATTMQGKGIISKVELRQFYKPNETLEESQKAIEEIKQNEPTMRQLLGTSEE